MQKRISTLMGVIIIVVIAVVAFGGIFAYEYFSAKIPTIVPGQPPTTVKVTSMPPSQTTSQNPTITAGPNGMMTYTNSQYGFSFQYPATLASTFAQFQPAPTAIISPKNSPNIDSHGCYKLVISNGVESDGTINKVSFCESSGGDPGAGQLYSSYYYTIALNGNYVTLVYIVHTPNGCDNYMGTANYQACTDFFANIYPIVLNPIAASVGTFKTIN